MGDAKDILGLLRLVERGRTEKRKTRKNAVKKPDGVHREVYASCIGGFKPPTKKRAALTKMVPHKEIELAISRENAMLKSCGSLHTKGPWKVNALASVNRSGRLQPGFKKLRHRHPTFASPRRKDVN